MKNTFNKTSFINNFSTNFRNIPFMKIKEQLVIINSVIFFVYNIERTIVLDLTKELDLYNLSILS